MDFSSRDFHWTEVSLRMWKRLNSQAWINQGGCDIMHYNRDNKKVAY